jgi:parvulin-like peptidyl-prolyl isomerase
MGALVAMLAAVAATLGVWLADAQDHPSGEVMATVGSLTVTREDFDRRARAAVSEYQRRMGAKLTPEIRQILERQVLESLIRANLLVLEAQRRGLKVTNREAEERLKQDPFFQENGQFKEAKFLAVKTNDPTAYKSALEKTKTEVAARHLTDQIESDLKPEEGEIRARAERALTRATYDYLALAIKDFPGNYREPREAQVLEEYRAHQSQYRRPERLVLSIVTVNQPPLGLGLENSAPAVRQWEARMKQRADSARAAIMGGADFEAAADSLGSLKRHVVVTAGSFPGYWKGNAKLNASVFKQAPGTIVPESVPGDDGWLLVRVDEARPAQVAPLAEVSREIRSRLREDARLHSEDRELQAIYDRDRAQIHMPAYRLRYAAVDTARLVPGEPSNAELDRYYRGHLADYTRYDAATASVVSQPFAEVRGDVRARWVRERKVAMSRDLVQRIGDAWSAGRRDRGLEQKATLVREVGPIPVGAPVDTGVAGKTIGDSLAARGVDRGVGFATYDGGRVVYHVHETMADYAPTFEEVRPMLREKLRVERDEADERTVKALFDQDPSKYVSGSVLVFSRLICPPPSILDVPLSRAEVERYHRDHIDKYSAPEEVRALHILVSPARSGAAADAEAKKRAEDLRRRVRAGEDFATLAEKYSDDDATRPHGGDLGYFGRGTMPVEIERTAYSLGVGEISDLVRTQEGYHVIKVLDHLPLSAEPLPRIYANVGSDAANEKALRLSRHRADSLYALIKTPDQARALGKRLGLEVTSYQHVIGSRAYGQEVLSSILKLEKMKPGTMYPGVVTLKSVGAVIQWVDTVLPPRKPEWAEARTVAIQSYRADAGRRSVLAKQAELDSLTAAGWSFDSVATLFGGLELARDKPPGTALTVGGASIVDSLVFGSAKSPALAPGHPTAWIEFPYGSARLRLDHRTQPRASELDARYQAERRLALEHRWADFYEDLKRRYPVRILDPSLRGISLPPLPETASR